MQTKHGRKKNNNTSKNIMAQKSWNMEHGTWNMEHGTWNMEHGTWNIEHRT